MEEYQPIKRKMLLATCRWFFSGEFSEEDPKLGKFRWTLGDYRITAFRQIYKVHVTKDALEVYGLLSYRHGVAIVRRVVFNRRMQVI